MPTLISYNDGKIPIGGTALVDHNLPVTVLAINPPYEEGDMGRVTVQYAWGQTEDIDPGRLGAYIDEG